MMTEKDTPKTALWVSLAGGILILISGLMFLLVGRTGYGGMMGGHFPGMMGGYWQSWASPMMLGLGISGIICGAIIIGMAYMLGSRPASHDVSGIVILVISISSLFGGGGFLLGAILGIIGGILAISWKPGESAPADFNTGP